MAVSRIDRKEPALIDNVPGLLLALLLVAVLAAIVLSYTLTAAIPA
ncbi:hypothetical protein F5X71_18795 [Nocardia brasiliensis]|uniref:Uncharacterized protein n=1 Tax=Nocardia brasiliensis TaxID=37326 RepID=A0A6G9XTC3_NOCBR|nr:hypothetical protein [Nocardia brasiliensis]QIS04100.1 hypothetical protein F5X71_18795 [Nocardia brasiliensis]